MTEPESKLLKHKRQKNRIETVGFSLLGSAGNLQSVGGMLITTARNQDYKELKENAKIAFTAIAQIQQGLQQLALGLAPIAGIKIGAPEPPPEIPPDETPPDGEKH